MDHHHHPYVDHVGAIPRPSYYCKRQSITFLYENPTKTVQLGSRSMTSYHERQSITALESIASSTLSPLNHE